MLSSPNTITMKHSLLFTVHFDDSRISDDLLGSDIPTPFDTPNRFPHNEWTLQYHDTIIHVASASNLCISY